MAAYLRPLSIQQVHPHIVGAEVAGGRQRPRRICVGACRTECQRTQVPRRVHRIEHIRERASRRGGIGPAFCMDGGSRLGGRVSQRPLGPGQALVGRGVVVGA
ncbi:hypothetical protein SDC9_173733 [bioreactor metagenome]|uniref:Uncharacterized protein n=1 Tax=bioreactor metagenome TaxID=1076179 RepID=A0A645GKD3_9ZZZZ